MKLTTVFLLVTIVICSYSATAHIIENLKDIITSEKSPQESLKDLLNGLGISAEHLLTGLTKFQDELGPEASEAVKKLLGALSRLV